MTNSLLMSPLLLLHVGTSNQVAGDVTISCDTHCIFQDEPDLLLFLFQSPYMFAQFTSIQKQQEIKTKGFRERSIQWESLRENTTNDKQTFPRFFLRFFTPCYITQNSYLRPPCFMVWTSQQHSLLRKRCHPHWCVSTNCNCFHSYIEAFVLATARDESATTGS